MMSEPLTEREEQVYDLVLEGFSTEVIADQLGVKKHWVEKMVSSIYRKLGLGRDGIKPNRTQLVYRGWMSR